MAEKITRVTKKDMNFYCHRDESTHGDKEQPALIFNDAWGCMNENVYEHFRIGDLQRCGDEKVWWLKEIYDGWKGERGNKKFF